MLPPSRAHLKTLPNLAPPPHEAPAVIPVRKRNQGLGDGPAIDRPGRIQSCAMSFARWRRALADRYGRNFGSVAARISSAAWRSSGE